ncbi:hypothetical protein LMH87_001283 [Akanthomyces muscarius]|uniref:C2H2 type master regulator of conidiophore development brlA n=1 Tax=Akanthomyces muscarius TaxID=2231603 RepID=A0A9W8QH44_AKAMU|nr:hypothetical protein LMH87_001283 [Akanthomyces muscarius]KAJ4156069.1 hypothetical protein LMH87_001283 [Akanthomyces muscarius]
MQDSASVLSKLSPQLARNLQQGDCTELNVPHDLTTTNSQLLEHSDSLILPEYSAASMAASYIMNDSVNTGLTSSYAIVNDPPEEVINAINFDSQVLEMGIRDGQNVFDFAESIGNGMASTGPASSDISAGIDSGSLPPALQCLHPSCVSKSLFWRKCDLDKHVRLHSRKYFCSFPDCHMAQGRKGKGFGTKRDMLRHEDSHNPSKACPYCGKLFSRQDNLRVHCRRQHQS